MADWITCPGCRLGHSRRPNGLCPRCKQSVDGAAAPAMEEPLALPPLEPAESPRGSAPGLGRLAQSARGKELKSAKVILLVVGILSAVVNGIFFFMAEGNVQAEINKELATLRSQQPGFEADPDKLQALKSEAVRSTRLVCGGGILLGLIFIGCAAYVQRYPVPATITGLALYLGATAVFGMLNPASLGSGLIVKIFVVVGLFKSVQAAIAYQKDLATADGG